MGNPFTDNDLESEILKGITAILFLLACLLKAYLANVALTFTVTVPSELLIVSRI